jgi:hypothetical protein
MICMECDSDGGKQRRHRVLCERCYLIETCPEGCFQGVVTEYNDYRRACDSCPAGEQLGFDL